MREQGISHVPSVFERLEQGSTARAAQIEAWRQGEFIRRIEEFSQDGLVVISEPHPSSLRIPKVILPLAAALELLALSACASPDQPAEVRPATVTPTQIRETPKPVQPTPTEKSKSSDSQATQPVSVIVEATNKNGTTTGIRVRRGDTLTFQASGAWCMGIGECGGSDGIRPAISSESDVVFPQAKIGALIGRIGSKMFSIGSKGSVTVETDGQLELLMNDRACCYGDNTGRIEVGILGGQFTSIERGPQRELTVQNPIKILPMKVEIKDSNEEGWKIVVVELGFENTGRNPVPVGLDFPQQFIKAMILTQEGFGYGIYGTARGVFGDIQSGKILPPGFRAKGEFWHGQLLEDQILDSRMAFKVARNTSGYKLQIPGFPDIDLEKEVERTKNLKFPTDRPDSDFKEFGGSFTIPGKGTVHFLSIERGQVEDDKYFDPFRGTKRMKDAIVLRARFDNANQGYDQSFSVSAKIIADNGIIYPAGLSTNIGPGLSKEAITSFPPHINGGKLVVTGDGISEIFNLRIQ